MLKLIAKKMVVIKMAIVVVENLKKINKVKKQKFD